MQLFRDFFNTDLMNHCEVLKAMSQLGDEDGLLLAPMIDCMARNDSSRKQIELLEPVEGRDQNTYVIDQLRQRESPEEREYNYRTRPTSCFQQ